jgi:DNA gyrase subunit B
MIKYASGENVVESIRVTTFVGSKMKVVTSTIRASGRTTRATPPDYLPQLAYIVQFAFYGVDTQKEPPSPLNKVGGRCSCFTGDTLIPVPEGYSIPIKDFDISKNKYVFSYDLKTSKVKIAEVSAAGLTRKNAKIVKVNLDNGNSIRCTEDHLFLTRDGVYVEAGNLTSGLSLMAQYRKNYFGDWDDKREYRMVCAPGMPYTMEHYLADDFNIEHEAYSKDKGSDRHHVDFNRFNNSPDNIMRLSHKEHYTIHANHIGELWKDEEFRKKVTTLLSERMTSDNPMRKQETADKAHETMKENKVGIYNPNRVNSLSGLERCWSDSEWRADKSKEFSETLHKMAINGEHDAQVRVLEGIHHWQTEKHSEYARNRAKEIPVQTRRAFKQISSLMKSGSTNIESDYEEIRGQGTPRLCTLIGKYGSLEKVLELSTAYLNHKVVSVEACGFEDVYDLTVPGYENFCIDVDNGIDCSSGVFVHNCKAYYFWFAWPNMAHGASFGTRFKPYVRLTPPDDKRYPPKNPANIPGLCKHQLLLAATLQNSDFYKRIGA